MNGETDRVYRALQLSFLTEAPARLVELRKEAEAFKAGEGEATVGSAHGCIASLAARRHTASRPYPPSRATSRTGSRRIRDRGARTLPGCRKACRR